MTAGETTASSVVDVIPLAEDVLHVDKRRHSTGTLRINIRTQETSALIKDDLVHEGVEVERIPIARIVDEAPAIRTEGDTTIIPVLEEVLVVEKKLFLREEVRLRRTQTLHPFEQTISLCKQTADIERLDQPPSKTRIPDMNQTITAMFDTRAEAQEAVEHLIRQGIGRERITVSGQEASASTTSSSSHHEDQGLWASLKELFLGDDDEATYNESFRRGMAMVSVQADEMEARRITDILEDAGAIDLDERANSWRSEGWAGSRSTTGLAHGERTTGLETGVAMGSGYGSGLARDLTSDETTSGAHRGMAGSTTDSDVIPIAEEELQVGKRQVARGRVRIHTHVVERPVQEQVSLREQRVDIERRPVSGTSYEAHSDPFQERTIDVEETAEEAVVSKSARVTEELVVHRDVNERTETISDTVRKTEVDVDDDRHGSGLGSSSSTGTVPKKDRFIGE